MAARSSVSIAPRLVLLTNASCGRPVAGFDAIANAVFFSSVAADPRFGLANVYALTLGIDGTPVVAEISACGVSSVVFHAASASAGRGSGIHLGTVLFAATAGIELTHIPYKGSGPALTDLLGNHVALYFSSLPPAIGLVKEGKLRALGVTGLKRSPIFPDVPTVAEQGLPGFEAVLHYGIVAPAGTPRPIIDKLNAALRTALNSGEVHKRIATEGAEPLPTTPDEYAADIDREETKWSALVVKAGLKAK